MNQVWLAAVSAGLAAWLWLPVDATTRLAPARPWRLPSWAQPLPEAMSARKRWWISAAVTVAMVFLVWDITWLVIIVAPLIAVASWVLLGRLEPSGVRQRRLDTLHALPETLDLIQACVQAGQPLRRAVETVSAFVAPAVADRLRMVTNAVSVGLSDDQAWLVLRDDPTLGSVARDLARCSAWGTTISDVLANHATDVRRQVKAEHIRWAKAVGVRSVLPLSCCYLPAFMLVGIVPIIAGSVALAL